MWETQFTVIGGPITLKAVRQLRAKSGPACNFSLNEQGLLAGRMPHSIYTIMKLAINSAALRSMRVKLSPEGAAQQSPGRGGREAAGALGLDEKG